MGECLMTKREHMEYAFSIPFGGMLKEEMNLLYDLSTDKDCIEIGSLIGQSTCVLAPLAKKVFCIDCWSFDSDYNLLDDAMSKDHYSSLHRQLEEKYGKSMFDVFIDNTNKYEEKIVPIKGDSKEVHKYLNGDSFDLIFIDGDHSYDGTIADYNNFFSKVKLGGLICFHDYGGPGWPGVTKAVDEVVSGGKVKLLQRERTLVVCGKVCV